MRFTFFTLALIALGADARLHQGRSLDLITFPPELQVRQVVAQPKIHLFKSANCVGGLNDEVLDITDRAANACISTGNYLSAMITLGNDTPILAAIKGEGGKLPYSVYLLNNCATSKNGMVTTANKCHTFAQEDGRNGVARVPGANGDCKQ